jgi:uncharacterized protein YndB with AHSA1/START domain
MPISDTKEFIISREFDAPRPLVFSCFTSPEHMQHWWGPKGITIVQAKLDFKPGGMFHYGMKGGDGSLMWGRMVFREIVAPERIVFINSFSDEKGGLTRAPFFDGKWPLEMLSVFTFDEIAPARTRFTVTWSPLDATDEERAVFAANFASMNGGWSGTLEKLHDFVATLK